METIKLNSKVVVSDPCYTIPTWCQAIVDGVLPGNYNVFCKKHDLGDWGVRNSMLLVIHENHANDTLEWESHPATIGVDSGQCGFFSFETYRNDEHAKTIPNGPADFSFGRDQEGDEFYNKMAQRTLSTESFGVYDEGAVCSSGVGDGSYMLFTAEDNDGNIIGLAVDFLIEGPEDEEDDTNNFIDFEFYKEELVK
jgi:hypothetical protein